MLHLICLPAGCSASKEFFAAARSQGYDSAIIVTSSRNLVQKARMQGINAVTFDYLANAVLRLCGRAGIRKISRKAQEIIVEEIINALLRDNKIQYFAGLVSKKGFLRSVTSLLDQLGCCGATVEEISSAFSCWDGRPVSYQRKDRDVAEIYRAYMDYLIWLRQN